VTAAPGAPPLARAEHRVPGRYGARACGRRASGPRAVPRIGPPGHGHRLSGPGGTALSRAEREAFRDLLAAEREQTTARVASLLRDWEGIVESSALVATDDEHDPEGSSTAFERAHVQALLDQARSHLADLDAAEERLRAGDYGVCQGCGRPISPERLKVRPAARFCVPCTTARR
jgi:DnaK suppressor protein